MKRITKLHLLAAAIIISSTCLQAADEVPQQIALMPRKELENKIADALQIRDSLEKVVTLVDLVRFSYPMKPVKMKAANEYEPAEVYVPAMALLVANKENHNEATETIITTLPDVTDAFYRRRLIHVMEKIHDQDIDLILEDKVPAVQIKMYATASARKEHGKVPPLDYFIPRVPTKEELLLDEAIKRAKERKKQLKK